MLKITCIIIKANLSGYKEYQISPTLTSPTDYLAQTTSYSFTTKCDLKIAILKYNISSNPT